MRKFRAIVIILTVLVLEITPRLLFTVSKEPNKANAEIIVKDEKIAEAEKLIEKEDVAKEQKEGNNYQVSYVESEEERQQRIALEKQQETKRKRDEIGGETEIQNLYKIVMAESGNQGSYGQQLVASVVINRMQSESFPNTITGVITQKSQFSPVANGSFYSAVPTEEVIEAVDTVIENGTVTDALYFLNPAIASTGWTAGLTYVTTYRDHTFYR